MEKLCIDVKGFSDEKKKRVQDAFCELGLVWFSGGKSHQNLERDRYGNVYRNGKSAIHLLAGTGDMTDEQKPYAVTYTQLMQKAGLDESDPDAFKLQPGDYTTREEIKAYAERDGLTVEDAYERLCVALITGGSKVGEGTVYCSDSEFSFYGWGHGVGGLYFASKASAAEQFTRHLTPQQILGAADKKRKESISFATQIPISMLFGRNVSREGQVIGSCGPMHRVLANDEADELATHNLRETIEGYMWLLDSIRNPEARQLIKQQLTDLQDLEFKLFNGEDDNA